MDSLVNASSFPILQEEKYCKDIPEPRSGHRCCATLNHLIVYGGYRDLGHEVFSDVICYNMISKKWTRIPNSGNVRLESASCSMLLHHGNLIIFGGSGYPFGFTNSNKLSSFSLGEQKWRELDDGESVNAPFAKYGQSMALSAKGHKIYVFSGTVGNEFVDEMHYFDFLNNTWHRLDSENQPEARYRHEVVADNEYFYVLGGAVTRFIFGFEEVYRFSFTKHEWTRLNCKPSNNGLYPQPRKHHSCVLHQNIVYMCGGLTSESTALDDIWKLNLDSLAWKRMNLVSLIFNHLAYQYCSCVCVVS